jgi:hypothetical protein
MYELGNVEAFYNTLLNYTKNLSGAKYWIDISIKDVLEKIEQPEFYEVLRIASEKAKPLLKIRDKGWSVKRGPSVAKAISKYYYVGLPEDCKQNIFEKVFSNIESIQKPEFIPTNSNDRVIIYRKEGVIPAFAIDSLEMYKEKYDEGTNDGTAFYGFDYNLHEKMIDESFDLEPKTETKDDSLELWVKGLILNFIKYNEEKKVYQYLDWKNGSPTDKYWISTGECERDKAFNKFKRIRSKIRDQYFDKINEVFNKKSDLEIKEWTKQVNSNYLEEFVQCEISVEKMKRKKEEYKNILDLIDDEMRYVNDKLYSAF